MSTFNSSLPPDEGFYFNGMPPEDIPDIPDIPPDDMNDELFERIHALEERVKQLVKQLEQVGTRFKQVESELIDQNIIIPF